MEKWEVQVRYFGRSTHVRHVEMRRAAWTRLHAFQMNFFPRHDQIRWDMGSLLKNNNNNNFIQTGLWSCEGTHPLASSSSSFGFRILYLSFFYLCVYYVVCGSIISLFWVVHFSILCFNFFSLFFEPTWLAVRVRLVTVFSSKTIFYF